CSGPGNRRALIASRYASIAARALPAPAMQVGSGRVGAQAARQPLQRADAARLGAQAPLLQVRDQLLAAQRRALPQRGEFAAHLDQLLQALAGREDLGEPLALVLGPARRVTVQPAPRRRDQLAFGTLELREPARFLGARAPERARVLRH